MIQKIIIIIKEKIEFFKPSGRDAHQCLKY